MAVPHRDSDDARFVSAAIRDRALCVPCIIAHTGATRARVEATLAMLGETLIIHRILAPCAACGSRRFVYRLG